MTVRFTTLARGTQCPNCQLPFDVYSHLDHPEAPKPGDYSVCYQCAAVLRFDDDGSPRLLTDSEAVPEHTNAAVAIVKGNARRADIFLRATARVATRTRERGAVLLLGAQPNAGPCVICGLEGEVQAKQGTTISALCVPCCASTKAITDSPALGAAILGAAIDCAREVQ